MHTQVEGKQLKSQSSPSPARRGLEKLFNETDICGGWTHASEVYGRNMRVPGGEINVLYNPSAFSLCFSLAIWIRELVGNVLLEVDVIRDSSAEVVFQVGKSYRGPCQTLRISSDLGVADSTSLGDDNF